MPILTDGPTYQPSQPCGKPTLSLSTVAIEELTSTVGQPEILGYCGVPAISLERA